MSVSLSKCEKANRGAEQTRVRGVRDQVKQMEQAGRRRRTTERSQGHVRVAAFTPMGGFSVEK